VAFITGGTGLLGRRLANELLGKGYRLKILTRRNSTHFSKAIKAANSLHEAFDKRLLNQLSSSEVEYITGDVTKPEFGLGRENLKALLSDVDTLWHCAADTDLVARHRKHMQVNVNGTKNVSDAYLRYNPARLNYVSTAFVHGMRTGLLDEVAVEPAGFRNTYEQTKQLAENMLYPLLQQNDITIIRPSILVAELGNRSPAGDLSVGSKSIHLVIRWIREVDAAFGRRFSGTSASGRRITIRVMGDPQCQLNCLPVDYCARVLAAIGTSKNTVGGIYQVVNNEPCTIKHFFRSLNRQLLNIQVKVIQPKYFNESTLTKMEQILNRRMRMFHPYMAGKYTFSAENVKRLGFNYPVRDSDRSEQFAQLLVDSYRTDENDLCSKAEESLSVYF